MAKLPDRNEIVQWVVSWMPDVRKTRQRTRAIELHRNFAMDFGHGNRRRLCLIIVSLKYSAEMNNRLVSSGLVADVNENATQLS
jgi:hypothetical protein